MRAAFSKRLLQAAVAIGSLVPILAGLAGVIMGPSMIPSIGLLPIGFDSHFHYLSGLLLGIGLGFWTTIPHIERKGERFRLLAAIVFIGGLARVVAWYVNGLPGPSMQCGLVMELVVTPLLSLWQYKVERSNLS